MSISELQAKSASDRELVLPLAAALEALRLFEQAGTYALGWEGWLRYPDGRLGHSAKHQGTAFELASPVEQHAWLSRTMLQSQTEHDAHPEVPGSELLFCITAGT